MSTWQCNSCGAKYPDSNPDGSPNFHVCPSDKITQYAQVDAAGNVQQPEQRQAIDTPRNENIRPDVVYYEGKPYIAGRDPNDPGQRTRTPADSVIIAEGKGRTRLAG